MATIDSLLLIAFIVVAVSVGKPLSYLNCYLDRSDLARTTDTSSAAVFIQSITDSIGRDGAKLSWEFWAGATQGNCMESKAIWGFSIALW